MRPDSRKYLWGPVLVLLITLGATAAVVWQLVRMSDAEDTIRFAKYVSGAQSAIDDQVEAYIGFLREGSALFGGGREPTPAQFRAYVAKINPKKSPGGGDFATATPEGRYSGILGVSWIRKDTDPQGRRPRPAPVKGLQGTEAGRPRIVLGGDPATRLDFVLIEPEDWRKQLDTSDDLFTDADSLAAMERARDTGKPVISGKETVIREFWAKKRTGFHIFLPVYDGVGIPATLAARRSGLRGFVQASVQSDEMFGVVHAEEAGQIDLQVYDGNESAPALLFRSDGTRQNWDTGYRPRFSSTVIANVPGRTWRLVFNTRPEFDQASERNVAPNVALIGVLLSLLLAGINLVQRRASAALNASELRYRRLFEASPDGVFLFDAGTGRITDANPQVAELLGHSREQLLERSFWEIGLFSDEALGRAAFAELRDKSYRRYDYLPIVTPAGRRHDVEFTCNSYMSGRKRVMQCNVRNITDRRRVEHALRESEERYRSLVEITPQGVWLVGVDGNPLYVNQYWIDYSGMTLEQSTRDWPQQIHPKDREKILKSWAAARDDGMPYESELLMHRAADGRYLWHLARGVPVHDAAGRAEKWLCVFIDIDERKQTEQERAQLLQREHTLRTQAEAANRAKDEFLATLSHELRTPLNAILGWTQTLHQGEADRATVHRALAQIDASANAQARLVNDLLNVADIGSGRMRLDMQPVDLSPLIDSIVESLRPAIAARNIAFTSTAQADAGQLSGDPARLQQIVWNLLSNAVKFTPHGGHIRLDLARAGTQIEIAVSDDGEGISTEFLPYVFDRFRQADASIKRRHGGLGLGLAIVRHLTELHGGTVSAQSAGEGRGARFSVLLPMQPPTQASNTVNDVRPRAPAVVSPLAPARPRAKQRLAGLRILSVDDDPNTREMLQEALQRGGAEVISAGSAQEALAELLAHRPDVLVSDIGLPEEDGHDLVRKIRALDKSSGGATPAVALTGYAREQDQKAALDAGYQEFVAKPVNLDELTNAILRAAKSGGL
jgi:PAS domain S-box-containing protein